MNDEELVEACEEARRKRDPLQMLPDTVLLLIERAQRAEATCAAWELIGPWRP